MELTKTQIQDWLTTFHGGDREWLAAQLGAASKGTIDHYFSRGFSSTALATILLLMDRDVAGQKTVPDDTALIPFTSGEVELIERARSIVGSPPRPKFYHQAIMQFVKSLDQPTPAPRQTMPVLREFPRSIVAEDSPSFVPVVIEPTAEDARTEAIQAQQQTVPAPSPPSTAAPK